MDNSQNEERRAFSTWIRTGRVPAVRGDALELKFNPYHDPRNGRFTFAPGGAGYGGSGIVSHQWRSRKARASLPPVAPAPKDSSGDGTSPAPVNRIDQLSNAVFRPDSTTALLQRTAGIRFPDLRSNSRPFDVPMTLEQTFPGLKNAPGGTLIVAADNLLDITGPANRFTTTMSQQYADRIMSDIRAIDPTYRKDSFGFPSTLDGQMRYLDDLRFDRAAVMLRMGEVRPMQTETYRFMQASADRAYADALNRLKSGRLKIRISAQETLGNFVDREVRIGLRRRYSTSEVDAAGGGPVRVNRRENNSSEGTFRRPDARVGDVAYDVTIANKTLKTQQVRGFFASDFKPVLVVIIRPSQLGTANSYIITRPGDRK